MNDKPLSIELNSGYAVIDLEMTGADYRTCLIIEIAVGVVRPGQDIRTDRVLVKIDKPIPERIKRLTGIIDRDLNLSGIPIDDALGWFVQNTSDLPLVGHSIIRGDRLHLLEAARRHRRVVDDGSYPRLSIDECKDLPLGRFIDTAALYKGYKLGEYPEADESHQDYAQRINNLSSRGLRTSLRGCLKSIGVC